MADPQGQTITLAQAMGRFLGFVGQWLQELPRLFWALTRRYAVQAVALRTVLLRKGLITEGELAAVEDEVRAGIVIDETVGAPADALAAHMRTFQPGAIEAITAPGPPAQAMGEAMQGLQRVLDLTTTAVRPLDVIRIDGKEYPVRNALDVPFSQIQEVLRLQAACAGKCWHEQLGLAHRQVRILIPAVPENVLQQLTGRQFIRILVDLVALLPPHLSPAPATAEPEQGG